ncbi:GntR family transcriptional regulator [Pedomonas mirosovicensis]|uniref:GntR family transcriptional regulator n=1 Tax=Pedomonas mirosovicensis TaxID=2908641 RepID=UPI002168D8D5|nr:GntR family transcriptional regulator [Pedomonas mirosovicensis]MCH8686127.1 GntR family transcriptional regulator [Pedomonas mirosovicensis]
MDPNSIEAILRDEIEQGRLAPGTPLKQEDLAARFKVSRQPVRRVLERLLVAGFLTRRSDRTVVVAEWSARQALELIGVRVALETHALRLSLPRLDERTLRKARRICEALLDEDDPAEIEELDIQFHRLLYSGCANDRLLAMIEDLRREGRRIYAMQPRGSMTRTTLYKEHQALLSACMNKDIDRAVDALSAHLSDTPPLIQQPEGDPA